MASGVEEKVWQNEGKDRVWRAREVIAHRQEERIRKSEVVVVVKGREHANKISKRVRVRERSGREEEE